MEEKDKVENIENNILNEEAILKQEKHKAESIEKDITRTGRIVEDEAKILESRKQKFIDFFKKSPSWLFLIILFALLILGVYIRMLPLMDHNPNAAGLQPGLWDTTTNDYTLGPDLDPFLFLRYARTVIENGSLPRIDTMRNVPLFFDTTTELQMVSYMIVLTYKAVNLFGNYSINFAGAFMPVWMFALTVIAFFFFVREIFIRPGNKRIFVKANCIALISTFFMIISPEFLARTIAGIPEKESVGFFFMFLAFYLFLKAWKSEKIITASIFGVLAGISTGLMGLTWGGVTYIYVTIALASLIAFLFNKFGNKEMLAYLAWLISALVITLSFTNRFKLTNFIMGLDTGLSCIVFVILIAHFIIWKTGLKTLLKLEKIKLPKTVLSLIFVAVIGIIAITIISPGFIVNTLNALNEQLIKPVTGRWNTTVAENRQPYFTEWRSSFGPNLQGFPVLFWLFFIGSVVLFYKMFNRIENKHRCILTGLYVLFFFGLVFSRYAAHPSLFDGENFISKLFYYGSALVLIGAAGYYYLKYHKKGDKSFEHIDFEYLFLFSLFVLCLFSARSAVRVIMVLSPIAPIFSSYLLVNSIMRFRESSDNTKKIIFGTLTIIVLLLILYAGFAYFKTVQERAYGSVPYYYTIQWQNAMSWVRENTSQDAVFSHWWDYGYWVQSIGNRATITDGGNVIGFWNYYVGRFVLTGDNQKDSLEFLYTHNATHLLIDSSDIGKYGAFSQIGSDENFDRLSQGPITLLADSKQTEETKVGKKILFDMPRGSGSYGLAPIEEDIIYDVNGTKETLFKENFGIMGVSIEVINTNESISFKQPEGVFYSQGIQKKIPLRYAYFNGQLFDFKSGINATVYIIPRVTSSNINYMGAAIYLSPRIMRGFLGQVYLLNNSLGNFDNFELVHSEPDLFNENLIQQGYNTDYFNYFDNGAGLQGPIKIWEIKYTGNETINQEYLLKSPPANIPWKF